MKSFKILLTSLLLLTIVLLIPTLSKATWKGYTTVNKVKVYNGHYTGVIGTISKKGTPVTINTNPSGKYYRITCRLDGKQKTGYVLKTQILLIRNYAFVCTAFDIHKYVRTNGYTYNNDTLKVVPLNANNSKIVDCSHYVSAVLYEYDSKYKDILNTNNGKYVQLNSKNFNNIGKSLKNGSNKYKKYFSLIKDKTKAKTGDILVYSGHVEILAQNLGSIKSKYNVYNCGSNSAIKAAEVSKSSKNRDQITYVLRVK